MTYIKNNIKEIKIIVGSGGTATISNNILTVENTSDAGPIWDALDVLLTANSIE
jgi:hypothetical protein